MKNKERYKQAFSALNPSDHFEVRLEEKAMTKKRWKPALAAVCAALAVVVGGTSVYAADVGGIQRTIQVWLNGDQTEAVLTVGDDGTYTITDSSGSTVQSGGGVAFNADGSERQLSGEEIAEHLENEVTTDTIDGKMYLLYKDQKLDLTGKFADSDYYYVMLKDGDKTIYVTVSKDGSLAYGTNRYLEPGKDF